MSEPLIHQTGNYFANADPSQDERDMFALNLTIFHWGMTGWTQYLAVALCCGLVNFRFQLPMTLRSCFYPLLGEYVWGYIGDGIDALAVVATITGVCTSLGLGAIQLATGLERVGIIDRDQTEAERDRVLIIEIWVITAFATCSVVSGLGAGIKYLSMLGLAMGVMLQVTVFCLDKTSFLLNVMVQEVGMYISTSLVTLNLHTDPFGQLHEGLGRATDGMAADENWMNTWTIFYTGWSVFCLLVCTATLSSACCFKHSHNKSILTRCRWFFCLFFLNSIFSSIHFIFPLLLQVGIVVGLCGIVHWTDIERSDDS